MTNKKSVSIFAHIEPGLTLYTISTSKEPKKITYLIGSTVGEKIVKVSGASCTYDDQNANAKPTIESSLLLAFFVYR